MKHLVGALLILLLLMPSLTLAQEYFPESYGAQGDGIADDTSSIQAAINAAKTTSPSTVKFTKRYKITNQITTGPNDDSSVSLVGNGTIVLNSNGGFLVRNTITSIRGLTFLQNDTSTSYSALNVLNVGHVNISDCNFTGLKKIAILLQADTTGILSNITISGSSFSNNGSGDIIIRGADATHNAKYVTVVGNTFLAPTSPVGAPTTNLQIRAIWIQHFSNDVVISGNTFSGSANFDFSSGLYISGWRDSIMVGSSSSIGMPNNVTVSGNTITGMCDDGVGISGANNVTISGNAIYGSKVTSGIYVPSDGSFQNDGIAIIGNVISDHNLAGIFLKYTNHASVTGNTITGCLQGIANVGTGIINVSGNTINNVRRAGITLNAIAQAVISNNIIDGFGDASTGLIVDQAGIFIDSGQISMLGNSIRNGMQGILLNGSPSTISIIGNSGQFLTGYGVYFISFTGASFIISNNSIGTSWVNVPSTSASKIIKDNI